MTPGGGDVLAAVREHLARIVQGRAVVMIASHVAGGGRNVLRHLTELGAGPQLVIAPDPFAELARASGATHLRCVIEEGENTVVTQQRWEAMLADPPPAVRRAIAEHDPGGSALMLIAPWLETTSVLDRPVFGARHPSWTRYEDKLAVDELWRAAGVPAAPSRNVPLEHAALAEASAALDHGHGTVWAADADAGVHGGAVAVRWIRTKADADAAITAFEGRHRRVRVMPFLAGRPCGIHGIAVAGDVIVLRPVEHVVARHRSSGRLRQAGAGTGWDPLPADRDAMREAARRVGAALQRLVRFRGSFTIDGVLTAEGFRPTECNPRWGAAISYLETALPQFPALLAHHAAAQGHSLGMPSADIEAMLVTAADRHRHATGWARSPQPHPPAQIPLVADHENTWRRAGAGERPTATLTITPAGDAARLSIVFEPGQLIAGHAIADSIVSAFSWADDELGTTVGTLIPPPE